MKLLLSSFCLAVSLNAAAEAPAPKAKKPAELPGTDMELKTQDGWTLKAKFKSAQPGQKTFVLLHGKGQRKEFMLRLANRLSMAGYGYLGVDLRGHGQSNIGPDGEPITYKKFKTTKAQNDFANMAMDVQAAVSALVAQYVPEESIGIIGTDVGGSVGLKYAAVHPQAPLLVMLSPGMEYQEVTTVNAMRAYKDRPILMIYGELDKKSSRETPILYEFAKRSVGERKATMIAVPHKQGVRLLNGQVIQLVLNWIINPVKTDTVGPSSSTVLAPGVPDAQSADSSSELILDP